MQLAINIYNKFIMICLNSHIKINLWWVRIESDLLLIVRVWSYLRKFLSNLNSYIFTYYMKSIIQIYGSFVDSYSLLEIKIELQ